MSVALLAPLFGGNTLPLGPNADTANYVSVRAIDTGATEGAEKASLRVARAQGLPFDTRVFFSIGGTARSSASAGPRGADYTLAGMGGSKPGSNTGSVLILAGQTYATVTLTAVDDLAVEGRETATFTILPNSAYTLSTPGSATIDIISNDVPDRIRINFQTAGSAAPLGHTADVGLTFREHGPGLTFGWDADNTASARVRNNPTSPDFRYDSLNHMQKDGADRKWEIAVPNGCYMVRVVSGDPNNTDSVYKLNVEDREGLSGTPSGDVRWFRQTTIVKVTDGRLTLSNAAGGVNNRINFIEIKGAGGRPKLGTVAAVSVRQKTAATASQWQPKPGGLFSDNQIDERLWV